jgi:ornithine--oxo-acid transaminase
MLNNLARSLNKMVFIRYSAIRFHSNKIDFGDMENAVTSKKNEVSIKSAGNVKTSNLSSKNQKNIKVEIKATTKKSEILNNIKEKPEIVASKTVKKAVKNVYIDEKSVDNNTKSRKASSPNVKETISPKAKTQKKISNEEKTHDSNTDMDTDIKDIKVTKDTKIKTVKVELTKAEIRLKNFPQKKLINSNTISLGILEGNEELVMEKMTNPEGGLYDMYIEDYSSMNTKSFINKERRYLCNNYAPLPIVLRKGNGIYVQDVDRHWYMDFLSGYSAVNHGHNNQKVIESAYNQMKKLYMTSRAFYNEVTGKAAETICKIFEYEKVLFMNSGVEAGESAIKIARRWGYDSKGIPDNEAKIVFAKQNFWGRTLYACGASDDPSRYSRFGPFDTNSRYLIEYNNIEELEQVLSNDPNICAVFLEPIQGEAGIVIPDKDYLPKVKQLCESYNCLLIVDEIQTGLGRAGHLLYSNASNIKPDIVLLAKSISAGLYPISAVLTSRKIMDLIKPGDHGSTYGGNPLASQILISALDEVTNLNLVSNANEMGIVLSVILKELENCKFIKEMRGRGLMFGLELQDDCPFTAYDLSLWLMQKGLLSKSTKLYTLRFTPPLIIKKDEIHKAADIIIEVLRIAEIKFKNYKAKDKVTFDFVDIDPETENQIKQSRTTKEFVIPQALLKTESEDEEIPSEVEKLITNTQPLYSTLKSLDDLNLVDSVTQLKMLVEQERQQKKLNPNNKINII